MAAPALRDEALRRQRSRLAAWAILAAALGLAGCSESGGSYIVGTDHWGAYDVTVESRPAPPRTGHNEVVVIVTGEHRQPVYDALVSVRAQPSLPWVQAIEDGHVGVYRRAVDFGRGKDATIEVKLHRGTDEAVLAFPVELLGPPTG